MNVIVSNKYQSLLNSLDIDIIKSINGVFTVEELVAQFANFYYNKMIIDITAIKDYENISVIQNLSVNFDMSKIILLLDDSESINSPMFLSQIVSMGIYNFTSRVDNIPFLINNPNTYKDVARFHNVSGFQQPKLNEQAVDVTKGKINRRVLGFRNITEHAGSTTLVYLLKNHLENYYKVKAVEIGSKDFVYFNDNGLSSIMMSELPNFIIQNSDCDVILVDLNGDDNNSCDEIIYLIEPGIVKLNKLISSKPDIFNILRNKKIVLNRSVLTSSDVQEFEKESSSRVFFNIPCLDDKVFDHKELMDFLAALGFTRLNGSGSGKGILGIFN